jgi:hypothetical protein
MRVSMIEEHDLSRVILEYLVENPEGKDTIEGIARFWITSIKVESLVHDIQNAVASLVERGYLKERVLRGSSGQASQRYYQVNGSRMQEIADFLRK